MIAKLLRDSYTGPDGKYYAIGRIYSAPVMLVGLGYPLYEVFGRHKEYDLLTFAGYLAGLGGAAWIFIRGHNTVDEEPPASA